ncbi:hypothetical protein N0V82_010552 [Gnomoniopsis sp. IMI 355080]|nr:hypothetical protein N0V82_010552 [Gnomoniopsis sp. IMI 355080]
MAPGRTTNGRKQPSFAVSTGQPPTSTRLPAVDADEFITKPGVARANAAVSSAKPDGDRTYIAEHGNYTVLQQHCRFWDRDNDGQIYPLDTFVGFRELGFNILFSFLMAVVIHSGLSYPTRLAHSWLPDPLFRIFIDSIHKAKHGSDSGTFDTEGRFRPQQFEDMFAKYDEEHDGTLTFRQLLRLMSGNRNAFDPFGWGAAMLEFPTTYLLLQQDGKIMKEDLRGVYDGSIFFRIREKRLQKQGSNQGYGIGGDGFIGDKKEG